MQICVDEAKLKELMKEAVFEVLRDHKDVIFDILAEVVEDVALAHAIREGEATEIVSEAQILDILKGRS